MISSTEFAGSLLENVLEQFLTILKLKFHRFFSDFKTERKCALKTLF